MVMRSIVLVVVAGLVPAAACGPGDVRERIEERPLEQATALDEIQAALADRNVRTERFQPIILPNQREWPVDVLATSPPIAVEFLTAQDRERIGGAVPIPATPNETPRILVVQRAGTGGRVYLRVFTDEHFRYQPNPPPDMRDVPYTIREVTARLRRDVIDFAAWYHANHGAGADREP